jgi:putative PIN family toxin of toxin-antitoxin system
MKTIRVVVDTNVIVSAFLNAEGYERHVVDLVLARRLQLVASEAILAEYAGVLRRPKFGLNPRLVTRSLAALRRAARIVDPNREVSAAPDPADNRFLECAESGKADYLVTGNKRHFPKQWRQTLVVNSREFLEAIVPDLPR